MYESTSGCNVDIAVANAIACCSRSGDSTWPSSSVPATEAMAYLKHAEAFLAKLPSISLEGLDQLGAQSSVKMQMAPSETQSYQVS